MLILTHYCLTEVTVLLKFLFKNKKGSWEKISYERRVYESVNDLRLYLKI